MQIRTNIWECSGIFCFVTSFRSADHYLILIGYLLPNIILQAVSCVSL